MVCGFGREAAKTGCRTLHRRRSILRLGENTGNWLETCLSQPVTAVMPRPAPAFAPFEKGACSLSPLKLGVMGCGHAAQCLHLPALSRLPDVRIAAVAEADPELRRVARHLAPMAQDFEDFRELLAEAQLDAVVICLPPALHAEAAVEAFERGLHVYLEKPLATNLEDGRRILDAWRAAGRVGQMGFNFRFHPLLIRMRDAVRGGLLGEPIAVHAEFCSGGRELADWKRRRAGGGGVLLDLASHQFDLVGHLLDRPIESVQCLLEDRVSEGDTALASLRLAGGIVANVFTALSSIDRYVVEVTGSDGQIRFDRYRDSQLRFVPARRSFSRSARLTGLLAAVASWPRSARDALFPPREHSYFGALAAFVESVRSGLPARVDLVEGLQILAVVEAAERSARNRRRVDVPLGGSEP